MKQVDKYLDILIDSCKSSVEQMTRLKIINVEKRQVLKDSGSFPFAHIIAYTDSENKIVGEFVLAFESVYDALKLASAISERLGIGKFEKICDDSTDLLNEFLNVVVGRTISEWDSIGLSVKFGTPVFKENFNSEVADNLQGYIICLNVAFEKVDRKTGRSEEQILLRVNFVEKKDNKIKDKTILLAEDSKVMRNLIAKILKNEGAIVKEANDGEEAVRTHKMFNPDLTLMDINMPKLNGLEAISQIKKFHPNSKFIILSSSSRKDEIVTAKTLKISGYLVKPVEPDKLIERVSAVLS